MSLARKNVVLLQPCIGDMDLFRDRPTPPLALVSAVSLLARRVEVRFVDQRLEPEWESKIAQAIDRNTVLVGITALTGSMIANGLRLARAARKAREDVPIVWGGVHPSLLPAQTVEHPLVDFVVQGEGEETLAALVEALAEGDRPEGIPGVWYLADGRPRCDGIPAPLDLNSLPVVPWEVVGLEPYVGLYRGRRTIFYQSSRGCPFRCAYCYNTVYNKRRWRARDEKLVLEDIRHLRRLTDFDAVYFVDDEFFINRRRAASIIRELHRMGLVSVLQGIDLRTIARMDDEELRFLEAHGVERITIGVESGSDRIRKDVLHKWGGVAEIKQQFARLANRKFLVLCSFIIGFPDETPEETRATIDLVLWILDQGQNFRVPQLYIYTPYPGTELGRIVEEQGYEFPRSLDEWARFEWDYGMLHAHDRERAGTLEAIVFLSKFLDSKSEDYAFDTPLFRTLYKMYSPLAKMRIRSGLYRPLPERSFYHWMQQLVIPPLRSLSTRMRGRLWFLNRVS